jgi:hypothetical protein
MIPAWLIYLIAGSTAAMVLGAVVLAGVVVTRGRRW